MPPVRNRVRSTTPLGSSSAVGGKNLLKAALKAFKGAEIATVPPWGALRIYRRSKRLLGRPVSRART